MYFFKNIIAHKNSLQVFNRYNGIYFSIILQPWSHQSHEGILQEIELKIRNFLPILVLNYQGAMLIYDHWLNVRK